MNIIEALKMATPYFHKALKEEAIVALADKESNTMVSYLPGNRVDAGYVVGEPINNDDENLQAALRGKNGNVLIPKDVYGVEINAFSFPVYEGNKVIGALGFGLPIDNTLKLEHYMNTMNGIIHSLNDKVQIISAHSQELEATSSEINNQADQVKENAEKSNAITDLIKGISRQTNLLGLNASIEAARAGIHGAGFNIVAQEVRKLSTETSNATDNIDASLNKINTSLDTLKERIQLINDATVQQAELVQDFSEIIEQLNALSLEMKEFMSKVL